MNKGNQKIDWHFVVHTEVDRDKGSIMLKFWNNELITPEHAFCFRENTYQGQHINNLQVHTIISVIRRKKIQT